MKKVFFVHIVAGVVISGLIFNGCKAKQQEAAVSEDVIGTVESEMLSVTEDVVKEDVMVETIPPSAAPVVSESPKTTVSKDAKRDKDIQTALFNAGFYTGAIDGKIGPKTKKAIEEFQGAKALKVDGKVGSKTWAELEKYLAEGRGD